MRSKKAIREKEGKKKTKERKKEKITAQNLQEIKMKDY